MHVSERSRPDWTIPSGVLAGLIGSCRTFRLFLRGFCAAVPHTMQQDSEIACDRNDNAMATVAAHQSRAPRSDLQPCHGSHQHRVVRFSITQTTRLSLERWIKVPEMTSCDYLSTGLEHDWLGPFPKHRFPECWKVLQTSGQCNEMVARQLPHL